MRYENEFDHQLLADPHDSPPPINITDFVALNPESIRERLDSEPLGPIEKLLSVGIAGSEVSSKRRGTVGFL